MRSLAAGWDDELPHNVHFQLSEDPFPCLTNLDVQDPQLGFQRHLSSVGSNAHTLTSYRAATSEKVLNLMTAFASICLWFTVRMSLVSEDGTTTTQPLAFEAFRPSLESHAVAEFVMDCNTCRYRKTWDVHKQKGGRNSKSPS